MGLSDFATYDQNGKKQSDINFPYQLIFVAPSSIVNLFPEEYTQDFTEQLKTIPNGSVLYEVYAIANPNGPRVHIANIVL